MSVEINNSYENEVWKEYYNVKVSNTGMIWSKNKGKYKGFNVNGTRKGNNHLGFKITLEDGKQKTIYVHRAVMELFGNRNIHDANLVIDHIDDNPHNNHISNLRLVTYTENNHINKTRSLHPYVK